MRRVGIIFAMREEFDAFVKYIDDYDKDSVNNLDIYLTKYNNLECIMVESGVGKVNAAIACQTIIDKYDVDIIINVGVSGGVDKSLEVFDIVVGNKFIQYDFDISAFNHNVGYIPRVGDYIVADSKLVDIACNSIDNSCKGCLVSGDRFLTDVNISIKLNQDFGAMCVDMESGAIAQVCYLNNINFLIVRSISDVLGDNNLITYDTFLDKSTDMIAKGLCSILNNL